MQHKLRQVSHLYRQTDLDDHLKLFMNSNSILLFATFGLGFVCGYYSHALRIKYLQAKQNFYERKAKETKQKLASY